MINQLETPCQHIASDDKLRNGGNEAITPITINTIITVGLHKEKQNLDKKSSTSPKLSKSLKNTFTSCDAETITN